MPRPGSKTRFLALIAATAAGLVSGALAVAAVDEKDPSNVTVRGFSSILYPDGTKEITGIHGNLLSTARCGSRKAQVFRVKPGDDAIAEVDKGAGEVWDAQFKVKPGTYYAIVKAVIKRGGGETFLCKEDRSATIKA